MSDERTRMVDEFATPFAKNIELLEVEIDGGVRFLRVRIREGSRFTILDLDPVTAKRWGEGMGVWAALQSVNDTTCVNLDEETGL